MVASKNERSVAKVWTIREPDDGDVDLYVQLDDGSEWVSTFVTPERARQHFIDSQAEDYPFSEYFSDPFVVIVSRIDAGLLADIAGQILLHGNFHKFFTRCKGVDTH